MGFHNVTLDHKFFGYGSSGGPGHKTFIPNSQSGIEPSRTKRWGQARRRFPITNMISESDTIELFEFVLLRRGSAHSFLIRDPLDITTATDDFSQAAWDDVVIGQGDGSKTEFTLKKLYTSGSQTITRVLNKPLVGQVFSGHGTSKVLNTDFTIDHQIGRVSYVTAPPSGDVKAGCQFGLQVRFSTAVDDLLGLSYDGFRSANYLIEVVEEAVATIAKERHVAHSELVTYGGGTTFSTQQIDPYYLQFEQGRYVEFTNAGAMVVRLPDVDTLIGATSLFTSGTIVSGGPYFAIGNFGTGIITLEEWFDPGPAWRSIGNGVDDFTVPVNSIREVYLDDLHIWRCR